MEPEIFTVHKVAWDGYDPYPPPQRERQIYTPKERPPRFDFNITNEGSFTARPRSGIHQPTHASSSSTFSASTFRAHMAMARDKWTKGELPQWTKKLNQTQLTNTRQSVTSRVSDQEEDANRPHATHCSSGRAASARPTRSHLTPVNANGELTRPASAISPTSNTRPVPQPPQTHHQHYRSSRPPITIDFDSSAVAPPRATNLTHVRTQDSNYPGEYFRPFVDAKKRFSRGWELSVPKRDDDEEVAIYLRNTARGIQPPLQTLTAEIIRHKIPKDVVQIPRSNIRLKKKMQPFFTLPETSDADGMTGALVQRRHQLDTDKNDWDQLRLMRKGLDACLQENRLSHAGRESTHSDWYQGKDKEFTSLFPASEFLDINMYRSTYATEYLSFDHATAVKNMHLAKLASPAVELDPRAKTNTKIRKLYRANYHTHGKTPKRNTSAAE